MSPFLLRQPQHSYQPPCSLEIISLRDLFRFGKPTRNSSGGCNRSETREDGEEDGEDGSEDPAGEEGVVEGQQDGQFLGREGGEGVSTKNNLTP